MSQQPYLQVENVSKLFGGFAALSDVSFSAEAGEFISILGPSGCGKTTLLRVVAGLERQDAGRVVVQGRDVSDHPVSKRNVGIVFQSYALFPNLSAQDNISYGLKNRKAAGGDTERRVQELLQLVGLSGMGRKYPAQLSGGQQQRVAWPGPSRRLRPCCCWTNPSRPWTPRCASCSGWKSGPSSNGSA